jgi:hypothetical protein
MYFQSEIFDIAFSKTGAEGMQALLSYLVCMTRFWNNLHQVLSKSKD